MATPKPGGTFIDVWEGLAYYAALRLFYAASIAALDNQKYLSYKYIATDIKIRHRYRTDEFQSLVYFLDLYSVFRNDVGKFLPGMDQRRYSPVSDHLEQSLRSFFEHHIPEDEIFPEVFDKFEYINTLVYGWIRKQEKDRFWAPVGSFLWRRTTTIQAIVQSEIDLQKANWPFIPVGLFNGSINTLLAVKKEADEFIEKIRSSKGIWF